MNAETKEAAHTPGPWNIDPSSGLDIVWGDDGSPVAQALGVNYKANARLIAAAPDMLTILVRIANEEHSPGLFAASIPFDMRLAARAAIAKASPVQP